MYLDAPVYIHGASGYVAADLTGRGGVDGHDGGVCAVGGDMGAAMRAGDRAVRIPPNALARATT
jgi:hypothetical protein